MRWLWGESLVPFEFTTRRGWRFLWQRLWHGWDDSVTWDLDTRIAKYLAPRLKRFKELNNGYPINSTPEKWDRTLDKMIEGFELQATKWEWDLEVDCASEEYRRRHKAMDKAWKLLAKHHNDIWW